MDNTAELFALGVNDVDSTGTAGIHIARGINLHAVRAAGLGASQVDKHAIGLPRKRPVRRHIKGADAAATEIADVQYAFVRGEGEPVRENHIIEQQRQGSEIGA